MNEKNRRRTIHPTAVPVGHQSIPTLPPGRTNNVHITASNLRAALSRLIGRPHPEAPDHFGELLTAAMSARPAHIEGTHRNGR